MLDLTALPFFLGVAIMLSMTIFQSQIADIMPVSNASPLIGTSMDPKDRVNLRKKKLNQIKFHNKPARTHLQKRNQISSKPN